MQFLRAATVAMFLIFGAIFPSYAQQDQPNEKQGKPEKRQGSQQQGEQPRAQQERIQRQAQKPRERGQKQQQPQQAQENPQQGGESARRQQPPQRQRDSQEARQPQGSHRTRQQAAVWQQQRGWLKQGGWRGTSTLRQGRTQRWETEHRTWPQRGGYGGYLIPQARFHLYFGSQHWFRMHRPAIYMGYPRFSYNGLSFMIVDPWPESWGDNWYDADDVYIDYDDGYYLYNRRYPGVGIAITVAL